MKLEDIQKLCDEATPGPWEAHLDDYYFRTFYTGSKGIHDSEDFTKEDAKFIAASRDLLPKLLAVAKAVKNLEVNYLANWHLLPGLEELMKALEELEQE